MKKAAVAILMVFLCVCFCGAVMAAKKGPQPRAAKFKPITGPEGEKMVGEIKDALEKVAKKAKSVSGTGSVENEFINQKHVKDFKFWLKSPGKLRLEFTAPDDIKGTLMVSDGKTFWNYIPAMKKVYKVSLKQGSFENREKPLQNELGLLSAIVTTPLEREKFWDRFELIPLGREKVAGADCYVMEFKMKSEKGKKDAEGMFNQYLWIERETGLTRQIEMMVFGQPELVTMKSLKINPKIKDSLFKFDEKKMK